MTNPIALTVIESSQAGEARRKAIALASNLGFNGVEQGKVGIVVTELANNLAAYTQEGQLLLHPLEQEGRAGIEIISLDKGPGISNISECLQDGFSTGVTSGNGLGAIQRLSDLFEIYSLPGQGTAILCQIWVNSPPSISHQDKDTPPRQHRLEIGAVCLPLLGEQVSGDAWASQCLSDSLRNPCGNRHLLLVSDGLGHGPEAAIASQSAVQVFQENAHHHPSEILEMAHAALRSTRGAAVAIAEINFEHQTVEYAGIGNITGCIYTPERSTSLVSHNGTLGHEVRKIQPFSYTWKTNDLLIMHSDGLRTQWRLDRYPGLSYQHPSLIAGVLYRDFNRGRDDVTVLVAREVNRF